MVNEQRSCIAGRESVDSACIALRGNSRRERLFKADKLRTLREGPDSSGAGLPFCPEGGVGQRVNRLPIDRFSAFVKNMRTLPLILVCLVLVGCGGGNDAGTATGRASGAASGVTSRNTVTPLKPRMEFPPVAVKDLQDQETDAATLVRGRDSIVLFVSLGCESCEELTALWTRLQGEIPAGMNVFGLADEEPDYARKYLAEHPFPFPLYCDTKGVFHDRYKMRAYPSVVGVLSDGSVAYVGKAVTTEFTPEKALNLLAEVKQARSGS